MAQAGESLVTWGVVISSMGGCGVVIGGLAAMYWLKARGREIRRERPPQPEKVLRPAGYYLQQRVNDLWDDLMFVLLQTLATGVFTGSAVGAFYPVVAGLVAGRLSVASLSGSPRFYVVFSGLGMAVAALLWTIRGFLVSSRLYDEIRKWRFGLRGEQAVAEKLMDRDLAVAGYVAFHDMPCVRGKAKWNVDHVVVGPGGVFVLETKARWKRGGRDMADANKAVFDGESLTLGGWRDQEVVEQVRRNADWVRELIRGYAPEGISVQPVIVVPGWYVESKGNYAVKAMNAKYLVGFLTGAKAVYGEKDLRGVRKKLDEVCRDLEF